jgi:hypothetical protein
MSEIFNELKEDKASDEETDDNVILREDKPYSTFLD